MVTSTLKLASNELELGAEHSVNLVFLADKLALRRYTRCI